MSRVKIKYSELNVEFKILKCIKYCLWEWIMKYKNILSGIFILRPNRFIAEIKIDGSRGICHVRNTGRCRGRDKYKGT